MSSPITEFLLYISGNKPSTFYNPGEKQAFAEQIRAQAGIIYAEQYDAGIKIFGSKKAFDAFIVDLERNPKYYIEIAGEEVQKMEGPLLPINDFMSYFTDIKNILKEAKDLNLDITKDADYKKFLANLSDRGPGVLNMARETIIKYVDGLQAQEEAAQAVAIAPQMPKNFLWFIILGVIILIYINK